MVCWARCPEAQPGPAAAHRHRGLALWSVQCLTDQQQWGVCSIRGWLSACRRRVVVLMTPFPPFGDGEITVRGCVVPKVQTTSMKNAENRGVVGEVVCVLGTVVSVMVAMLAAGPLC